MKNPGICVDGKNNYKSLDAKWRINGRLKVKDAKNKDRKGDIAGRRLFYFFSGGISFIFAFIAAAVY